MHLQCFTPTRTYKRDDHYPICTKLHWVPACIVWPYYACSYTDVEFSGHFFLLSVSATAACYTLSRKLHTKLRTKIKEIPYVM